jgi:hypothetical protein
MIIAKSAAGQQVIKDRSVPLTPRQRSALVLFDGKRSLEEVMNMAGAAGVTLDDVRKLVELGLVMEVAGEPTRPAGIAPRDEGAPALSEQERFAAAYPIAGQLTGSLGLRGFRLNLAVEAAASYDDLVALAPKIKEAVGAERFQPLARALDIR